MSFSPRMRFIFISCKRRTNKARPRMYKPRIGKWNLRKNYKATEWKQVGKIMKSFKEHGQVLPKTILVGGRPLQEHRYLRYDKNHCLSSSELLDNIQLDEIMRAGLNSGIHVDQLLYRVRMSSKPKRPLSTPPHLASAEILLHQVDILCDSLLRLKNAKEDDGASDKEPSNTTTTVGQVFNMYATAFYMMSGSQQKAGWRLTNEASDLLVMVLQYDILDFLESLLSFASHNAESVARVFEVTWRFASELASQILGSEHPISIICHNITGSDALNEILNRVFEHMSVKYELTL